MRIVFFAAIAVVVYTVAVFPLLMIVRGAVRKRPIHGQRFTPHVSIVIAARDEAASIAQKLESILATDYPLDRREIVVVSDGSTDGTDAIVRAYAAGGVKLISTPARGKAEAVLTGVQSSSGPILVFTDANGVLDRAALRRIVWSFGDPAVGGVAGDQRYRSGPGGISGGEHRYWTFDRFLKRAEGRGGDVVAASGGLYAIRRELFEPIPSGVNDDLFLSTGVVQKGRRLVFAPDAVAYESLAGSSAAEVRRKIRIMTRGMRTVWARRRLLNPLRYGFYSIELLSHKVLRWFLVVPLLALAVTGPFLWDEGWLFRIVTAPLIALYLVGAAGILLSRTRVGHLPAFSLPAYLCAMNVAVVVAAWNVLRGRSIHTWRPARPPVGGLADASPVTSRDERWTNGVVALAVALCLAFAAAAQPLIVAGLGLIAGTAAILAVRPDVARLIAFGVLFSNGAAVALRLDWPIALIAIGGMAMFAVPLFHDLVIRRERIELVPALPFLCTYTLVQVLSAFFATRTVASGTVLALGADAGARSVLRFTIEGLALFVVLTNIVRTREILRRSLMVLLAVAAAISALSITNVLRGSYEQDYLGFVTADREKREDGQASADELWETKYGGRRHAGPLRARPNRWGAALVPLIPIGWALTRQISGRMKQVLSLSALVLTLSGVVLTFSRGTFLGLTAGLVVMVLLKTLRVRQVLAAVAVALGVLAMVPAFGDRVLTLRGITGVIFDDPDADADSSIRGRFTTSVAAFSMFLDHPIVGVGPGNYTAWYREYANQLPVLVRPSDRKAHNLYLGTAAETGILGLLALGAVLFVTLRELLRARRSAVHRAEKELAAAFFAGIVALLVNMLTLHASSIRYFWLYIALAGAAGRILAPRTGTLPAQATSDAEIPAFARST